jgi:hypothetical protein
MFLTTPDISLIELSGHLINALATFLAKSSASEIVVGFAFKTSLYI